MAARRFAAAFFAAACFAAFRAAAFFAAAFLAAFFCFGVSFFQAAARSAFFFAAARSAFFFAAARSAFFFAAARFRFWSAVDPAAVDRTETWAVEADDEADAGTLESTTSVPLRATSRAVTQPTSGRPCGRGMSMDSRDRRPRTEGSRTRQEGLRLAGMDTSGRAQRNRAGLRNSRTRPCSTCRRGAGPGPAWRALERVRGPSAGQSSAFGTPFSTTTSGEVIVGAVGETRLLFAATRCGVAGARPPPVGSEKFA